MMQLGKTISSPLDSLKTVVDRNLTKIAQLADTLTSGTADRETVLNMLAMLRAQQLDALCEHVRPERQPDGSYAFEDALVYDNGDPIRLEIREDNVLTLWYPRYEDEAEVMRQHDERVNLERLFHEGHHDPADDK